LLTLIVDGALGVPLTNAVARNCVVALGATGKLNLPLLSVLVFRTNLNVPSSGATSAWSVTVLPAKGTLESDHWVFASVPFNVRA